MGPFALPLPEYRLGIHPHANKRRKTGNNQEDEENIWTESEWDAPSSRLPSESINPLSHTPDILRQFAVAGLSPTEEVPSTAHPLFPHKPLPLEGRRRRARGTSTASGAESGDETDATKQNDKEATPKQYSERLRHLSTLTAIMHRCLDEGDIARAKRAFGLLVRTRDVDVRQGGMWAVGSEILMRDGEEPPQDQPQPQPQRGPTIGDNEQQEEAELEPDDGRKAGDERRELKRWGSAANVEKVKAYLEALVQQHPHDPHRPYLTSALDFWPALFGIEVYNVDAELRSSLHSLQVEEEAQSQDYGEGGGGGGGGGFDTAMTYADEDEGEDEDEVKRERREAAWAARDEVRLRALDAADRVARHMDQVMENAPYATHRGLLRLRGHVALFVGDLCLPTRLVDDDYYYYREVEDGHGDEERRRERRKRKKKQKEKEKGKGKGKGQTGEDVLRERAETPEEYAALTRRRAEQDTARTLFRKLLEAGGEVEGWVREFVNVDEDEDEEEEG